MSDLLQGTLLKASDLIEQIIHYQQTTDLIRDRARTAFASIEEAREQVEFIAQFLPLDQVFTKDQQMTIAEVVGGKTNKEDDGHIVQRISGSTLAEHRDEFTILDNLIRWGANLRAATVFKSRAFDIARILGEEHDILDRWIRTAQFNLGQGRSCFTGPVPSNIDFIRIKKTLTQLQQCGVLEKKPRFFRRSEKNGHNTSHYRCQVTDDLEVQDLLRGHWLSAFARWVIEDHAKRNKVPAQIISRLELQLPKEAVGLRNVEYDVLALFELPGHRKLIWFECKSGSITNINAEDIISAKNALAEAAKIGSNDQLDLVSVCLIPTAVTAKDEKALPKLEKLLGESDVAVWLLPELRKHVHALFA